MYEYTLFTSLILPTLSPSLHLLQVNRAKVRYSAPSSFTLGINVIRQQLPANHYWEMNVLDIQDRDEDIGT